MAPLDWNGHKQFLVGIIGAFPDFHHNMIEVVAERDKVAVRFNITATHEGEFQGIPPTGKEVFSMGRSSLLSLIARLQKSG
jgi:predicted ester cyclase